MGNCAPVRRGPSASLDTRRVIIQRNPLWEKIRDANFEAQNFPFVEEIQDIYTQLYGAYLVPDRVCWLVLEFKRFMFLVAKYHTKDNIPKNSSENSDFKHFEAPNFLPSPIVDRLWRLLCTNTRKYQQFCDLAFGAFLDRGIGQSPNLEEYQKTLEYYDEEFGQCSLVVWPPYGTALALKKAFSAFMYMKVSSFLEFRKYIEQKYTNFENFDKIQEVYDSQNELLRTTCRLGVEKEQNKRFNIQTEPLVSSKPNPQKNPIGVARQRVQAREDVQDQDDVIPEESVLQTTQVNPVVRPQAEKRQTTQFRSGGGRRVVANDLQDDDDIDPGESIIQTTGMNAVQRSGRQVYQAQQAQQQPKAVAQRRVVAHNLQEDDIAPQESIIQTTGMNVGQRPRYERIEIKDQAKTVAQRRVVANDLVDDDIAPEESIIQTTGMNMADMARQARKEEQPRVVGQRRVVAHNLEDSEIAPEESVLKTTLISRAEPKRQFISDLPSVLLPEQEEKSFNNIDQVREGVVLPRVGQASKFAPKQKIQTYKYEEQKLGREKPLVSASPDKHPEIADQLLANNWKDSVAKLKSKMNKYVFPKQVLKTFEIEINATAELTNLVFQEYLRFMIIYYLAKDQNKIIAPHWVKIAWECHIIQTASYRNFCYTVFGSFIHSQHLPRRVDQKQHENYSKTLIAYKQTFSKYPPTQIWANPEDRFDYETIFSNKFFNIRGFMSEVMNKTEKEENEWLLREENKAITFEEMKERKRSIMKMAASPMPSRGKEYISMDPQAQNIFNMALQNAYKN